MNEELITVDQAVNKVIQTVEALSSELQHAPETLNQAAGKFALTTVHSYLLVYIRFDISRGGKCSGEC